MAVAQTLQAMFSRRFARCARRVRRCRIKTQSVRFQSNFAVTQTTAYPTRVVVVPCQEAQNISDQTKAGMVRAKAKGARIGRRGIGIELRQKIAERARKGESAYAIALALSASIGTPRRNTASQNHRGFSISRAIRDSGFLLPLSVQRVRVFRFLLVGPEPMRCSPLTPAGTAAIVRAVKVHFTLTHWRLGKLRHGARLLSCGYVAQRDEANWQLSELWVTRKSGGKLSRRESWRQRFKSIGEITMRFLFIGTILVASLTLPQTGSAAPGKVQCNPNGTQHQIIGCMWNDQVDKYWNLNNYYGKYLDSVFARCLQQNSGGGSGGFLDQTTCVQQILDAEAQRINLPK
jgi:hypothetical protein